MSVKLLGPAEVRDLAELLGIQPTKKLGQNFVHDGNTVRRIVRAGGVEAGDEVLEVGPGLGSLTLGLLEAGARVTAIEIDRRLAAQLPATAAELAPEASLTVITEDALKVTELPTAPTHLVANLPYNVSVPVLLHLLEHVPSLRRGLVMVQAEVGERLAAAPGGRVYGAPSAKAAWYGRWSTAGLVSRQVFWPVPNVDSILVGFARGELPGTEHERRRTFALVEAGFGQRRKMIRQSLADALGGAARVTAIAESAGIDPTARSERLTVLDFLALARASEASPGLATVSA
ncbi:16S rRNA (adenine(1518)-N(6)/adenine(1519)-N(6))-dimethyltransferase RsmA [Homoserinibacter sp. YIM 151385]|uniref:16S rRNA (adenine(1518)-N(6)/adenine(1519)-N(6))- dimethyltransferase RsmA n=1 Tax=Homoserinibacter sp. YIM 151385 TaxID=2985506 RepID=UPI0022F0B7CB|nr:16S rRNA (adenine(1518)-N(6)/adenine(1519)-N(6))-dimethyltransferase RsmA [Homoserinibacter sp. YIM 151385]WBU37989.1 16S rRNA (adenine(1518)-N(6)/adenine(1519)-N(6))-dimethyltransferase RsmA [Homoserinibacter sp. YIM 151385]